MPVTPLVSDPDYVRCPRCADLNARLDALETVMLELLAERDRAVAELARLGQQSLLAEPKGSVA